MQLTPNQMTMIANALALAHEGFEDNHVEAGGVNTDEDIEVVGVLRDVLRSIARRGVNATLTIFTKRPADSETIRQGGGPIDTSMLRDAAGAATLG